MQTAANILALLIITYGVTVACALTTPRVQRQRAWLTMMICAMLIACLVIQLLVPSALSIFERNGAAVYAGEWWRIVTALFFQDGGLTGGAFNILLLCAVGTVAEQYVRRPHWITIYMVGGVASELIGLSWQPIGAGNSVASCALAGSTLIAARKPKARLGLRFLWILIIAAAGQLLAHRDIHGAAFVIGIGLGFLLSGRSHPGCRSQRYGKGTDH